jgi:hypothetical protein
MGLGDFGGIDGRSGAGIAPSEDGAGKCMTDGNCAPHSSVSFTNRSIAPAIW